MTLTKPLVHSMSARVPETIGPSGMAANTLKVGGESARGLAQSKTLARHGKRFEFRKVLDCASPLRFFTPSHL